MRRLLLIISLSTVPAAFVWAELAPTAAAKLAEQASSRLNEQLPSLLEFYRDLHSHPELSTQEVRTAGKLAAIMREQGFEVTEKVGGTGIVCLLKNGAGPTVLVRTDMDALPVTEKTGLPYASKVEVRDGEGRVVGVMHACGHDVHMTCWVGAARLLSGMRDRWSGSLVFIGQPAEERGIGAKAMLEDGLFERFPKPDFGLALHCEPFTAHGEIGVTEGLALANVDSVDVLIRGKGGHGAAPHTTIDPVVIAAKLIIDLQTLVSRELDPLESGVVTVGSIHGGSKHNIIPPDVALQLTVRSFKDSTRRRLLDGIRRKAKAAADAAGAPEPIVKVDETEFTPATYNQPELTRATSETLKALFGAERIHPLPPVMGGEDFSRYGRAGVPCFMLRLGTVAPDRAAEAGKGGAQPPSLHSNAYAPVPEPTIRTGALALAAGVLRIVGK